MNQQLEKSRTTTPEKLVGPIASDLKQAAQSTLSEGVDHVESGVKTVSKNLVKAQQKTENYLKKNILGALGISAGIGALLGLGLIWSRRNRT